MPQFKKWILLGMLARLASVPLKAAEHSAAPDPAPAPRLEEYRAVTGQITQAARETHVAFARLAYVCDTFGPRPTGSTNLESAIDWILQQMKKDGLQNVHGEPVQVPHWVRGAESAELLQPRGHTFKILAVGGSVPTPAEGIQAEVLVVQSFEELDRRAAEARGKIVLFNVPFTDYGTTVAIRTRGAGAAARAGAVASLIRSVGPFSMQTPHTGTMSYDKAAPKIPHAALTVEDASMLQRMQERGQKIELRLKLNSQSLPMAVSRNVVAELPGREKPEEVVVLSGHIDSWDVGQGAMDDGGGCLIAWEAVRLIKQMNLRPRRTLRVVLWTGEENGLWGAKAYHAAHAGELPRHVLAIESDRGAFQPQGFAFTGSQKAMPYLQAIAHFLEPLQAGKITWGAGGMDVLELVGGGVPAMDLVVDRTKYFWFHHSEADTVDKLDPEELNRCTAAMAIMGYAIAEMPESLPR